jgi:hypothetical protein
MDQGRRWVIAIIVIVSIVALLAFARGGAERGNPDASPAAITIRLVA